MMFDIRKIQEKAIYESVKAESRSEKSRILTEEVLEKYQYFFFFGSDCTI